MMALQMKPFLLIVEQEYSGSPPSFRKLETRGKYQETANMEEER